MLILLRLLIALVATGGFFVAWHIRRKKRRGEKLICPLNSDCEKVVHSRYSTFLGWPLELFGLGYFGLVALSYFVFLASPPRTFLLPQFILWLSAVAFLFSLYLTYIQAVKLREWCTWCLISALFSSIIFLTSLALYS